MSSFEMGPRDPDLSFNLRPSRFIKKGGGNGGREVIDGKGTSRKKRTGDPAHSRWTKEFTRKDLGLRENSTEGFQKRRHQFTG